jgi:hypothetical protein
MSKYVVRARPEDEIDGVPMLHEDKDYIVLFRDVPEEGIKALEDFHNKMKELGATTGGDILYRMLDAVAH